MTPDEIAVLMKVHSEAFKDCIEMFIKEHNRKFDKHEQLINQLNQKCTDLQNSLEFTQGELDVAKRKLASYEDLNQNTQISDIQESIASLETRTDDSIKALNGRCDYLEDSSRRQNLRFTQVPDSAGETWEQSAEHVLGILRDQCDLPEVSLERAHRVGPYDPARTRPIVARFTRFRDRDAALRNYRKVKNPTYKIREDLCEGSKKKRADQWPKMKEAFQNGKTAYFNYTTLVTRDRKPEAPQGRRDAENGSPRTWASAASSDAASSSTSNTHTNGAANHAQAPRTGAGNGNGRGGRGGRGGGGGNSGRGGGSNGGGNGGGRGGK